MQKLPPLVSPSFPDDLSCFCCGGMCDSPFSFPFLALSEDSSDEDEEEDDDGGDDEGGGGGDEFSCVQFGSRYQRNGILPPCMCIGAEELTLMSPDRECALTVNRIGSHEAAFRIKM